MADEAQITTPWHLVIVVKDGHVVVRVPDNNRDVWGFSANEALALAALIEQAAKIARGL